MTLDYLLVNEIKYPLRIYLENRTSSRVSIGKKGINIRLPRSMREADIEKQILFFKDWAVKKIQAKKMKMPKPRNYKHGDELVVGKKKYKLHISREDKKTHGSRVDKEKIILNLSRKMKSDSQIIKRLISRAIAEDWRPWLNKRIDELNKTYFNKKINQVRIKYNKTNWGSCSTKKNINISTRLFFAPDDIIDYVIVHELAHLIEQNHSSRFWDIVKDIIPDFKKKRKWLKENYHQCDF